MRDLLLYLFGIPGIFSVLLVVSMFYLYLREYKKARLWGMSTLILMFVFSCYGCGEFFGSLLIKNLTFKQIKSLKDVDLIVMPSQGIEYNGVLKEWLPTMKSYTSGNIAYDLQSRLSDKKVPVLICGGQITSNVVDSEQIKAYFTRQYAQVKRTMTEGISKNLYEQAWQCSSKISHYGAKNPVLVTDEIKMLRTLALFRERGIELTPIPVFSFQPERSWIKKYLPSVKGMILNQEVLNEYLDLAFDFMNGKIKMATLNYKEPERKLKAAENPAEKIEQIQVKNKKIEIEIESGDE